MKTIALILIGIFLVSFIGVCIYLNQDKDFFEENNIIDTTPIGRDLESNWIYQTADNKIIKTKEYPTTPEGIAYAKLVEVDNNG